MKTQNSDHKPEIDALEFAIQQIYADLANGSLHNGHIARRTIVELQLIRFGFMLADRDTKTNANTSDLSRTCNDCGHQMSSVAHAKTCGSKKACTICGKAVCLDPLCDQPAEGACMRCIELGTTCPTHVR